MLPSGQPELLPGSACPVTRGATPRADRAGESWQVWRSRVGGGDRSGVRREAVMAQRAERTPDGWIVTDLRAFRALTEYAPPRPWGYWDQIRSDVHEPIIV